jgi:two-component system chemotaxis response regulator CheB
MEPGVSPIVVIGASAGGIQALLALVGELPSDFRGAVFVVVHIGRSRSVLPSLLERAGTLPATHAKDGEVFQAGHIYVAPPDQHMLVRSHHIELSHGPRENHSRPAIDPLFRSAAASHGQRTIGIVLSGALSDGAAGLMMIKGHGGTAVVQDPRDAIIGAMPENAMRVVDTDYMLSAADIGRLLATRLDDLIATQETSVMKHGQDSADEIIKRDMKRQEKDQRGGELTMYTCPDCGGTLWQADSGPVTRFQCHVGHAWGVESLLGNKSEELEAALWLGVRLLEERATLTRQLAARINESSGDELRVQGIQEQAMLDERRAEAIRALLNTPLNLALQIAETGEVYQSD